MQPEPSSPHTLLRLLRAATVADDPRPALRKAWSRCPDPLFHRVLAGLEPPSPTPPGPARLPPREAAVLRGLIADRPRDQALWDAVIADPTDRAARAVLADWLVERGDPRGVFMQLQRAGTHARREHQLLEAHRSEWLGPLEPIVRGRQTWEDGLLTGVRFGPTDPGDVRRAVGSEVWATVKTIRTTRIPPGLFDEPVHALLTDPVLFWLESHDGPLRPAVFWDWVNGPPRPLKHVAFAQLPLPFRAGFPAGAHPAPPVLPEEVRRSFQTAPGLPELSSLALRQSLQARGDEMGWLLHSPLGERLDDLEVFVPIETLGSWVKALADTDLERFVATHFAGKWRLELTRDPTDLRRRFVLHAHFAWNRVFEVGTTSQTAPDTVSIALESVADDGLAGVETHFKAGTVPSAAERERLDQEIARVVG